jgi:RNA recognition motif-containing protein
MSKKLYVGNLNYNTTEDDLRGLFGSYGTISSLHLISDRDTGRPKGFGFVVMSTEEEAQAALSALNSQEFGGRRLKVDLANDRPQRRNDDRW